SYLVPCCCACNRSSECYRCPEDRRRGARAQSGGGRVQNIKREDWSRSLPRSGIGNRNGDGRVVANRGGRAVEETGAVQRQPGRKARCRPGIRTRTAGRGELRTGIRLVLLAIGERRRGGDL